MKFPETKIHVTVLCKLGWTVLYTIYCMLLCTMHLLHP